jgi:hypothetical protein
VAAGSPQVDEVGFLFGAEFGLFAPEASFGLRDGHAFAGAGSGEVDFELGDHGQHVEQESADGDRWGRGRSRRG